ncbi:hypothetical protein ACFQ6V_26255 [Streptomyces roseifaciens]
MTSVVSLKPEHIPGELRGLLETYETATRIAGELHQRLVHTPLGATRTALEAEHGQAADNSKVAHQALAAATRDHAPQMRQHAANAFATAVDQARANITAAEVALRDAAALAALHASLRDGRPNLNADTRTAADSKPRQRCMAAVSALRDLDLPDGIDD